MKKNAIMLADTRPWLIGHVLLQLQQTNTGVFDEALIYYNEMTKKDQDLLSSIMPCRFVPYQSSLSEEIKQLERFKLFSDLMFARYEMFQYLDEFETITWIDTDVLIQKSLAPVLEMAKQNGMAANFEDSENCSAQNPDKMYSCFITPPEGYDCDRYNMSSGLICVSDTLPMRDTYTQWLYDTTEKYASILSLPDQGVLNMFIQRFQLKPACIGGTYCAYPYYQRDTSSEAVVHAWGSRKFWNNWYVYNRYPQWQTYYKKWLAIGGDGLTQEPAPLISVVIPCYKPNPDYLQECLDSLLKEQIDEHGFAFDNFEVIIVIEPVEYEETQTLVKSYQDPRLVFCVNPQRYGIAKSLNQGMKLARGTYIARMDDDDIAAPMRFYRQATYLTEHPEVTLCTSDFEYFGDMNEYRITFEGELSQAWSIFTCPFDHPTIMFRRDFFEKNDLYYDETRGYVEDWELWLRAFRAGMTVGCVHEGLFFHRWHNGSAGQNNRTVEMMRQLVQKNFAELNVTLQTEDLPLVAPWNGRLCEEEQARLQEIFDEALRNNQKTNLYDQTALQYVFELRMAEARDGRLPDIVLPPTGAVKTENCAQAQENNMTPPMQTETPVPPVECIKPSLLRRILKKILKPFYAPFRNRYETPLWEARGYASGTWDNTARLLQQMQELQQQVQKMQQDMQSTEAALWQQLREVMEAQQTGSKQQIALQKEFAEQIMRMESGLAQQITRIENGLEQQRARMESDAEQQTIQIENHFEQQRGRFDWFVGRIECIENDRERHNRIERTMLKMRKKCFLLGTSDHSNIGDAAIAVGALEFIRRYFPEYDPIEISTYEIGPRYSELCAMCNPDDLIFLQGGGNLGNRFMNEENLRRRVIADFPNNHIVILPQTIYFDENAADEVKASRAIYELHPNLQLFTRGEESLRFAQKQFAAVPSANALDMALLLQCDYGLKRQGLLLCIRDLTDESGLTEEQYLQVVQTIAAIDPAFEKTNNLYDIDIPRIDREHVVYEELKRFASHRVIVTDRLHGLIFAIITGTPCVVIRAFNQKIREFVADFADSNAIFYIDRQLDNIPPAIEAAMRVDHPRYPILEEKAFERIANIIRDAEHINNPHETIYD